jgi:hypothetical protein
VRALLITAVVALPMAIALAIMSFGYLHTMNTQVSKSLQDAATWLGTYDNFLLLGIKHSSAALAAWFISVVCTLSPLAQLIWSRNHFRGSHERMMVWTSMFILTFVSALAIGVFWFIFTVETSGQGPMGGFWVALISVLVIAFALVKRFIDFKRWCGIFIIIAAVCNLYLANYSLAADDPLRPSLGATMRFVEQASITV